MTTLAPSFLIQLSSFLQVRRACIKAWMTSNFGQIPPPTPELSALECLKIDVRCCEHSSAFSFELIFFSLAVNKDNHTVLTEFEFRPDPTTDYGVSCS